MNPPPDDALLRQIFALVEESVATGKSLVQTVGVIDERVGRIDERVGRIDERVAAIAEQVARIDATLDTFRAQTQDDFAAIKARLYRLENPT